MAILGGRVKKGYSRDFKTSTTSYPKKGGVQHSFASEPAGNHPVGGGSRNFKIAENYPNQPPTWVIFNPRYFLSTTSSKQKYPLRQVKSVVFSDLKNGVLHCSGVYPLWRFVTFVPPKRGRVGNFVLFFAKSLEIRGMFPYLCASRSGTKSPPEAKMINKRYKMIRCTDLGSGATAYYSSLSDASEATGITKSNISRVLSGERLSCRNFTWNYVPRVYAAKRVDGSGWVLVSLSDSDGRFHPLLSGDAVPMESIGELRDVTLGMYGEAACAELLVKTRRRSEAVLNASVFA